MGPASADHVSVTMPSAPESETAAASRGTAAMGACTIGRAGSRGLGRNAALCGQYAEVIAGLCGAGSKLGSSFIWRHP